MSTDTPDTRRALLLVTGALVALVASGKASESDEITFTEMFDDLGTTSIGAILDQADAAPTQHHCLRSGSVTTPRTKRKASSRAHTPCPHCGKKLHGERGLKMHLKEAHK